MPVNNRKDSKVAPSDMAIAESVKFILQGRPYTACAYACGVDYKQFRLWLSVGNDNLRAYDWELKDIPDRYGKRCAALVKACYLARKTYLENTPLTSAEKRDAKQVFERVDAPDMADAANPIDALAEGLKNMSEVLNEQN